MKVTEFLDSMNSSYQDWIKEWDSLSKSEKIKRLPEMDDLVERGTEDAIREERGEPRIHEDSLDRMIIYNRYRQEKIKELK